jgi:hypothetical protein
MSARDEGIALPFTTARFWAITGKVAAAKSTTSKREGLNVIIKS